MHQLSIVNYYLGLTIRLSFTLLFFIVTSDLFGQKTYEGIVKDKLTNEAIRLLVTH
jgi:hypothetical protein